ncbi:hypothetical protein E2320_002685, partial [Naja naja]
NFKRCPDILFLFTLPLLINDIIHTSKKNKNRDQSCKMHIFPASAAFLFPFPSLSFLKTVVCTINCSAQDSSSLHFWVSLNDSSFSLLFKAKGRRKITCPPPNKHPPCDGKITAQRH